MKREILKQMIAIAGSDRAGDLSYDIMALMDYDGEFIWSIYGESYTFLQKCSKELFLSEFETERSKYDYARNGWSLQTMWGAQRFFWCSGDELVEVNREEAEKFGKMRYDMAVAEWKFEGNEFPTELYAALAIRCPMYLDEQLRYAKEHNDDSLANIISRLERFPKVAEDHHITIFHDLTERSFIFVEFVNGVERLRGGIIFHGYKEEGYKENGSVSMSPEYGWQMHT